MAPKHRSLHCKFRHLECRLLSWQLFFCLVPVPAQLATFFYSISCLTSNKGADGRMWIEQPDDFVRRLGCQGLL